MPLAPSWKFNAWGSNCNGNKVCFLRSLTACRRVSYVETGAICRRRWIAAKLKGSTSVFDASQQALLEYEHMEYDCVLPFSRLRICFVYFWPFWRCPGHSRLTMQYVMYTSGFVDDVMFIGEAKATPMRCILNVTHPEQHRGRSLMPTIVYVVFHVVYGHNVRASLWTQHGSEFITNSSLHLSYLTVLLEVGECFDSTEFLQSARHLWLPLR